MLVLSHSTTLPIAPVVVWVIFSSIVNEPEALASKTDFTALNVVAVAAEPPDLGSLIIHTRLKSLVVLKSPEFDVSAP